MTFYLDEENANDNYSYATFEESIGGCPTFIYRQEISLIIPVINQGIYDLKSFNNGGQTPIYFDRSYYIFRGVSELTESMSIREGGNFAGVFENKFQSNDQSINFKSYYIELEKGFNGSFFYGAGWKAKAREFGVLIPKNANQTEDETAFFKDIKTLSNADLDFLLNRNQTELEDFIATL